MSRNQGGALLSEADGHSGHDDNCTSCIMSCTVVDAEHAGKSTVRKHGDLIRVVDAGRTNKKALEDFPGPFER